MNFINNFINVNVYRFDPESNQKPFMQTYRVEQPDHSDQMVLTLLLNIKEQDPSLSFRHACHEGVCGSDGLNINGTNALACVTAVSGLKQPIVIRPLPGLPVIKDLVVDMQPFYQQYEKVDPFLKPNQPEPAGEYLQSPEERAKLDGLYECILCGCCSTACPSFWWHTKTFLGPAAALQLNRFLSDSRDGASEQRLLELDSNPDAISRCRTIMNCTEVCPKGLNPSKAIADIRHQLLSKEI